ncbi:MAG: phage holin family protein [SAR324 cluster bacterium]
MIAAERPSEAEPGSAASPGFAGSVRRLGRSLLASLRTRAELLSIELAEEKERRQEMLILAVLGALFLALGLQLVAFLVVVVFWDSYRVTATAGVTVLYVGISAWAFLRLRSKWRNSPSPFAASLDELAKDMDALQGRDE